VSDRSTVGFQFPNEATSIFAITQEMAPSPPRKPPTSGFEELESDYWLEEETFSWYDRGAFYPARIGEIFKQGSNRIELDRI
jgi:hypothetical protein